jgi:hypothetical protein
MLRRRMLLGVAIGTAIAYPRGLKAASFEALFAPGKSLWSRWTAHDDGARCGIDHGAWEELLGRYLSEDAAGIARIAYRRVGAADRALLRRYIDGLAAVAISRCRRAEQLAYWINLYNALTVDLVLAHYPVRKITEIDISPGLFAHGPWDRALATVEGEAVTLNDIEHRILRPIWNDPRIHYAVNCASLGCPNLQSTPFAAARIEAMLDAAAHAYVNHPRGVRIEREGLVLSKIYDWFQEDFGGSEPGVIAHLKRYAGAALADKLAASPIARYEYNWSLNDAG